MSVGDKIAIGCVILAGAGFAACGLQEIGTSLIHSFNHAASPEAQVLIKGAAIGLGIVAGGAAGATAAGVIHSDQELGVIAYIARYGFIGIILGGFGGYSLADKMLSHQKQAVIEYIQPQKVAITPKVATPEMRLHV